MCRSRACLQDPNPPKQLGGTGVFQGPQAEAAFRGLPLETRHQVVKSPSRISLEGRETTASFCSRRLTLELPRSFLSCVFFHNVTWTTTAAELKRKFGAYGTVEDLLHPEVQLEFPEDA